MFCGKCGKQIAEDAKFCSYCGNQTSNSNLLKERSLSQQNIENISYEQETSYQQPVTSNSVLMKLKSMASSPMFLIAIIAYSTVVMINLLSVFNDNTIISTITEYDFTNRMHAVNSLVITLRLIFMTPVFLICIGLWITYVTIRNPEKKSTSGLTLIKISTIISLVVCFIVVGIVVIASITVFSFNSNYGYMRQRVVGQILMFDIIFAIIITFVIVYYINIIKTVNVIIATITTEIASDNISGLLGVFNCILAGFTVIGLFISFALSNIMSSAYEYADMFDLQDIYNMNRMESMFKISGLSVFSSILSAMVLVLFAIIIFKYKKEMKQLV